MAKRKRKQSKGKIDGMERSTFIMMTLIYCFFAMVMYGVVKTQLPDLVYIWGIPMDIQEGAFLLAFSLWSVLSIFIRRYFETH